MFPRIATPARQLALLIGAALLAGCTPYAAWNAPGFWRPDGANAANLRAMIADPHDLVAGRAAETSLGSEAAAPVEAQQRPLAAGTVYAPPLVLPSPGGSGS
jgi:type IV pilus biogenesis protein CpaD/CtpE